MDNLVDETNRVKRVLKRRGQRRARRRVYLYVPSNLKASSLFAGRASGRYVDYLHYWVHLIMVGGVKRKVDRQGYTRIKMKYLRRVIPAEAIPKVLKVAKAAGVFVQRRRWVVGKESMGYKLCDAYRAQAPRKVACRDPKLAEKILRLRQTEFFAEPEGPVHEHLLANLRRLGIDRDAAMATVLATNDLLKNFDVHATAIDMIASGHVEFSHCRFGRVHSLVTRLARELRQHLSVDGRPLVNIDVACSQPLLVASLILNQRQTTTTPQPQPHPPPNQPTPTQTHNYTNTVSVWRTCEPQDRGQHMVRDNLGALESDERAFLSLCESGTMYEFVRERSGLSHVPRGLFKARFFRDVLYDRYFADRPMMKVFEALFPNVTRFIRDAKQGNYRAFSQDMQRHESSIVIGTVCRRLMEEYPAAPVITIHDSVLTTPDYVPLVRTIMAEEFYNLGLRPTLKVDGRAMTTDAAA